MRLAAAAFAGTMLLLLVGGAAHAQTASPPPPLPPPDPGVTWTTEWYGWQTLAADAGAASLIGAAFATNGSASVATALTGLGVYLVGAPIVHAVNGRGETAAGDIGLRLVTPFVGAMFGAAALSCTGMLNGICEGVGAGVGLLVGAGVAAVLDASLLAYRKRIVDRPSAGLTWTPTVSVAPQGMTAGVGGAF